ncbi:hypothetical protein THTE_0381 [Thermogutta terrifontis]|uniref:Uncharacterized protein n=1 Tax=Thermogutta terrifontis TaxID=1331910 RepID=A0A286RAL5_9BACT|nr:hypothetical protein THTE_0381 [Thermogutta terrifontis]
MVPRSIINCLSPGTTSVPLRHIKLLASRSSSRKLGITHHADGLHLVQFWVVWQEKSLARL